MIALPLSLAKFEDCSLVAKVLTAKQFLMALHVSQAMV